MTRQLSLFHHQDLLFECMFVIGTVKMGSLRG